MGPGQTSWSGRGPGPAAGAGGVVPVHRDLSLGPALPPGSADSWPCGSSSVPVVHVPAVPGPVSAVPGPAVPAVPRGPPPAPRPCSGDGACVPQEQDGQGLSPGPGHCAWGGPAAPPGLGLPPRGAPRGSPCFRAPEAGAAGGGKWTPPPGDPARPWLQVPAGVGDTGRSEGAALPTSGRGPPSGSPGLRVHQPPPGRGRQPPRCGAGVSPWVPQHPAGWSVGSAGVSPIQPGWDSVHGRGPRARCCIKGCHVSYKMFGPIPGPWPCSQNPWNFLSVESNKGVFC